LPRQSPTRTGLKVGLPGAKEGLSDKDPTRAELLKPLGYMTGQFGKNHLGDRNEFLPTVHGFDEFFGNLYHFNAEDEPEHPDLFVLVPAQAIVGQHLSTFQEFPPRQKPGSFSIDQAMGNLMDQKVNN
jgi:arylsulfatase A-like enzyme